jgi:hypothetical protein
MSTQKLKSMFLVALCALFVACGSEPEVVTGRQFNRVKGVVADTTSTFYLNDTIVVQLDNHRGFDTTLLHVQVWRGATNAGKPVWRHEMQVKKSMDRATFKGPDAAPLRARAVMGSTPGVYRIAFLAGDSVLAFKDVELKSRK